MFSLKRNETFRAPYVGMLVPFAACKRGPPCPWCLSNQVGGMTHTCAPVSTRKRRPVLASVMNSCGSYGPADVDATVGPPWRFPGSSSAVLCTWDTMADISLLFHRTFGGVSTFVH